MRSMVARHRLVVVAAAAASVALVAACAPQHPAPPGPGGASPSGSTNPSLGTAQISYAAGMALVADGSTTVKVGDTAVTFPTKVSDPSFAPDGSRIAFVDGDGNVATARPDGTGLLVLTHAKAGVVRSRPTWQGSQIVYASTAGSAAPKLMAVYANGGSNGYTSGEYELGFGLDTPDTPPMSAPSGAADGPGRELAFQSRSGSAGEVWVADLNGRSPYADKLVNGTEPALSRDGKKIAYVGRNGQISVANAVVDYGKTPVSTQVSFGATNPTHLAWSADGTRILFRTATDVESIAATVPSGARSNPATRVSASPGTATVLPTPLDTVMHLGGADPVAAAIAASKLRWLTQATYQPSESSVTADGAVLVGLSDPAAALAGVGYGGKGPVLVTGSATLDPRTRAELKRIIGTAPTGVDYGPTVILVGGPSMISTAVENAITAMGYRTERVAGQDAVAMSLSQLDLADAGTAGSVVVVSADNPAGLVFGHDIAGYQGGLIVVKGGQLPAQARTYLNAIKAETPVYALDSGAQAALGASWSGKRVLHLVPMTSAGPVLRGFHAETGALVVVDRSSPSDVIVAYGMARSVAATVLVLDSKAGLPADVKTWLEQSSGSIDKVYVVDSVHAFAADTERAIGVAVSGPLSYATAAVS